jgi:3-hydroxy acid dehydrogenase / malonic semialdehyde reductase
LAERQVVFITGASSGIGYATALAFARRGYDVAGTARRADKLNDLQTEINGLPGRHGDFLPIAADVRDREAVQSAIGQTVSHFGRLDIVVANAGVGHRGAVADAEWDDLETLLRTNIDGVLHTIRAAVPVMRLGRHGGHIVIISSVVHNMTSPYAAAYAASKAFVSSLAKSLRLELEGENISVTDMWIGRTESEFNQKRLGAAGYSSAGGRLPVMTAERVAEGIVEAVEKRRKGVALRLFDRLILLANTLVPELVGRRALKQYKV